MRLLLLLLMLLLVSAMALSGCLEGSDAGFEVMTVKVTNAGTSAMPAAITVTSPSGEIVFSQTLNIPGGSSIERTLDTSEQGTWHLKAHYKKTNTQGGSTQIVDSSHEHTLLNSDCDTREVVVEFSISYSSSSGAQSFTNRGSHGICVADE